LKQGGVTDEREIQERNPGVTVGRSIGGLLAFPCDEGTERTAARCACLVRQGRGTNADAIADANPDSFAERQSLGHADASTGARARANCVAYSGIPILELRDNGRIKLMAKYGKKASEKVEKAMHERKKGTLKSGGSGKKVTSKKQAIAIGLSEARKAGGKVPKKKSSSKKKTSKKKSSRKKTSKKKK
jgi:hypothetical protein